MALFEVLTALLLIIQTFWDMPVTGEWLPCIHLEDILTLEDKGTTSFETSGTTQQYSVISQKARILRVGRLKLRK
jgi:hypothetical protein